MAVSCITPNGEVFLQQIETITYIEELLDKLNNAVIDANRLSSLSQVSVKKLYLAKYSADDTWYRAIPTFNPTQADKVNVKYKN